MDLQIDNRGLEPPEPMSRILKALGSLSDGDTLVVLMDREPVMLYGELERRGYVWTYDDSDSPVLTIRFAPHLE